MPSEKLVATNVSMEYVRSRDGSRVAAIDNIDLAIEEGQFTIIVGPSGCGKTTFLNIVAGLSRPTAGVVLVDGHHVEEPGPDRAMVFQDSSLFPWYTVEENVSYGLVCQGMPKQAIQATVGPLIEMVGLRGFERHYPYELSGGMQQRANLARALAVNPALLLMDEPFASLDAQTREIMQSELLRIWEETKKTVLFITHQISEAIYLGDSVVVMSARPGRIIARMPVALPRPRSLDVKHSEPFQKLEQRVWQLLEGEVRREMASDALAHRGGG